MADISKIQILSGTYNVKDETARTNISNINSEINNIKNQNKPVGMNKVIFIGDSYGRLSGQNTWIDVLISRLGLTSSDYYRYAENSTGFENYNATTNHRFIDLLQEAVADIPTAYLPEVTHIIVCGGANDMKVEYAVGDITARISAFVTYANTYFPNAKVYVGMIGFTTSPTSKIYLGRVLEAYEKCIDYGAIYLNGIQNVSHNYLYFGTSETDTVHPIQLGSTAIGNGLYEALLKGYVSVYREWLYVPDSAGYNGLYCSSNNDIYRLKLSGVYRIVKEESTRVLSPNNPIVLFDFVGGCVGGVANRNNGKQYDLIVEHTDGTCEKIHGTLGTSSYIFENNIRQQLVFTPCEIDVTEAGSGGYKVIEDIYGYWITQDIIEFNIYDC